MLINSHQLTAEKEVFSGVIEALIFDLSCFDLSVIPCQHLPHARKMHFRVFQFFFGLAFFPRATLDVITVLKRGRDSYVSDRQLAFPYMLDELITDMRVVPLTQPREVIRRNVLVFRNFHGRKFRGRETECS